MLQRNSAVKIYYEPANPSRFTDFAGASVYATGRNPMEQTKDEVHAASGHHRALHAGNVSLAEPTHEDVARRAYDIYIKTGCRPGQCERNWHLAEKSLRDQVQAARAAQERSVGVFVSHSEGGR